MVIAEAGSQTDRDLIAGLEKAVAAGERSLGAAFFQENQGHFWGILETRPYMRARAALASQLLAARRIPDATAHFEQLLTLNPNDNQGVRGNLLNCYLAASDLKGAQRLLDQYEEDCDAVFNWSRTIERLLAGDEDGAGRALRVARQQNRFVELYLTGRKEIPRESPGYYSPRSEEEAQICIETLAETLIAHNKLMMKHLMANLTVDSAPPTIALNIRPQFLPLSLSIISVTVTAYCPDGAYRRY